MSRRSRLLSSTLLAGRTRLTPARLWGGARCAAPGGGAATGQCGAARSAARRAHGSDGGGPPPGAAAERPPNPPHPHPHPPRLPLMRSETREEAAGLLNTRLPAASACHEATRVCLSVCVKKCHGRFSK